MLCLASCKTATKEPLVMNTASGGALGTSYQILFFANERKNIEQGVDSVFNVINRSMSTYIPTSDISKINEGDTSIIVDDMFKEVFQLSKKIHGETYGYFDPTVGVLVDAWGFGPGKSQKMDKTKVERLLELVGFDKVLLTSDNKIKKENPDIRFDFNAIAKGYAIDRLAVLLDNRGYQDYLIEVGGEIVTKGRNQLKQKAWNVGIDDPEVVDGRRIKRLIHLKDRALASSGNYRKFRIDSITGKKYVHTIDPKTGYTKNSDVLATTVLAVTCAEADGYATAFMAMDLDDSIQILSDQDMLEAYIVYLDKEGNPQEYMTNGFRELLIGKGQ